MNNNKIDKIDRLLENDMDLEKYINKIEKNKIEMPMNLKEKIMSKINKKRKIHYADICKIAACLIFSLAICRTDFIKEDKISNYKREETNTSITINEKLSDFCKWFTTPIEINEEEK